jgi:hypothetical protein
MLTVTRPQALKQSFFLILEDFRSGVVTPPPFNGYFRTNAAPIRRIADSANEAIRFQSIH